MNLLIIALFCLSQSLSANEKSYTFGVVPQQAAETLARNWIPVLSLIKERSGIDLVFKTDSSISTFEEKLAAGVYDFAYMNPYHYTAFHERTGYQAFAKAADKQIMGVIVVHKNSPITTLNDLQGKTIAFPAPNAFAASILPRAYLQSIGINITPVYVNSHDSVYANVALGHYPVGGGVVRTLTNTPPKYRDELKVLWTTKGYTPHAFASLSTIDSQDVKKIQEAMTTITVDATGRKLLEKLKLKGIEAASNSDWDDVRALKINSLRQ